MYFHTATRVDIFKTFYVSSFSYIWKRKVSENSCVWLHMTFAEAMFCLFETQGLSFLLSKSSVVILTPLVVFLNVLYLTGLCQIIDSSNFWCVFRLWQGSLCPDEWWRPTILNIGSKRDPICHYCWGTEEACFLRKDLWNKKM